MPLLALIIPLWSRGLRYTHFIDTMSAEKLGEITATIIIILLLIYAVRRSRRNNRDE